MKKEYGQIPYGKNEKPITFIVTRRTFDDEIIRRNVDRERTTRNFFSYTRNAHE